MNRKNEPKEIFYKSTRLNDRDPFIRALLKIFKDLNIPKTAQILDTGCGAGYVLSEIHKQGYRNIRGIDIYENAIEFAKDTFKELQDKFEVHDCYYKDLPSTFPKTDYDIILSNEVIEHFLKPKDYLKNISFWLKDEGLLFISTPYHGYIKNLLMTLFNRFDKHFNPLLDGEHIKFFSKRTLYSVLEKSNIKPLKFYGLFRIPFLWRVMLVVGKKCKV